MERIAIYFQSHRRRNLILAATHSQEKKNYGHNHKLIISFFASQPLICNLTTLITHYRFQNFCISTIHFRSYSLKQLLHHKIATWNPNPKISFLACLLLIVKLLIWLFRYLRACTSHLTIHLVQWIDQN